MQGEHSKENHNLKYDIFISNSAKLLSKGLDQEYKIMNKNL